MSVTFHLPASAAERLAFSYSPALEAVLSLHVIVEPKHHPVQHPWVRAMRSLAPGLKREIGVFAFAYRSYLPEFLFPAPTGELLGFHDELERIGQTDPELARLEFALPLMGRNAGRDPAALNGTRIRAAIRRRAAREGEDVAALVDLCLEDPPAALERFAGLLSGYWEAAFAREWGRIEPQLADSVSEAGLQIEEWGVYALLARLGPEVRSDLRAGRFWLDRPPHDHDVDIGPGGSLVLVPSCYAWPHVRVNCDTPWPLGLVFPASSVVRESRPRIPPEQLVSVLRALGEDTRLRVLRLIAERPRSTQELAPLLGISEAALSKHLRVLAAAGLVQGRREGYYVLYRLLPARLAGVAPSLLGFLRLPARGGESPNVD